MLTNASTSSVPIHRVWGPESNDLVLQLRKRKISKIILGGMLANMCVESHLRELLEQGFEVAVVKDATAGPKHPEWGYGGPQQLRVSRTRRPNNGRSRKGDGALVSHSGDLLPAVCTLGLHPDQPKPCAPASGRIF
jgi:hypothetical protein